MNELFRRLFLAHLAEGYESLYCIFYLYSLPIFAVGIISTKLRTGSSYHQEKMSVVLKFVFLLSKQTYNFVSTPKRAYLSRCIDEIIIPEEIVSLDIVKRETKCIKLIKTQVKVTLYHCNINKQFL